MKLKAQLLSGLTFIAMVLTGCTLGGNKTPIQDESYTIKWKNWDGVTLEVDNNVKKGTLPTYDGSTPTRSGDARYTYTFNGWSPSVELAKGDAYYIAQYTALPTEEERERQWNISHGVIPKLSIGGKTITYGLYPQTNVNDSTLISALNRLTTPEPNGWYLYNNEYYAKLIATPYSFDYKFDNGTTILKGTTYWFKCEPIVWNILSNNDGECYILSSVLLDAHCYYHDWENRKTTDDKTIYPSNYEYSDIREWLNEDFYNSAFALDNSYIQTTTVDNGPNTNRIPDDNYACGDTEDKVFLPSFKDYVNGSYGFPTLTVTADTRRCITTDWTKARGTELEYEYGYRTHTNNGRYWTRSPAYDDSDYAWCVTESGWLVDGHVCFDYCVRPAITIKIA